MSGDLYFRYSTLDLNYWQRFVGRIGRTVFNIVLVITAATMLLSDAPNLFALGLLAALYLVFWVVTKFVQARARLKFKGGNLINFITPKAREAILAAHDRSAFLGGSFLLHLTRELIEEPVVIRVLRGLDVGRDEFISKLEAYLTDEKNVRETNIWRQAKAEEVVVKAFILQGNEKQPISPFHLFLALPHTDNERVRRLFVLFGLGTENLERAAQYHSLISA
jgi:hypothetical protein